MQKEPAKFFESDIMEGMTSISAVIKSIQIGKSDRKIITVLIDQNKNSSKRKEINFLIHKSNELGFNIEYTDGETISKYTTGNSHGGIIAFCSQRNVPELSANAIVKDGVYYLLEGIEDPYNFGYAARSVFASGGNGIILPRRNWMGVSGIVARSSAGTSELIDMFVCTPEEAVVCFKRLNYRVICAGIRDSESIFETNLKKPLLVVLGGEKRGISRSVLDSADKVVRIDYANKFNGSLSTAAATAVFAFEILRNNL